MRDGETEMLHAKHCWISGQRVAWIVVSGVDKIKEYAHTHA